MTETTTMRGTRLGSVSFEPGNVPSAPTRLTAYTCPAGHVTRLPFAVEADEVPDIWECECGLPGVREGALLPPEVEPIRRRSHWDMVLERRSRADLLAVLDQRLMDLHQHQQTA
jgi:hypothetical protein